jgi:4-hydroxybenzoate polyprenyltransferase
MRADLGQNSSIQLDFFLLVFSTVLIAAAGNIINDYFDVKADRVNKPEKVIIGKHIKPRWAIVTHWIFNTLAFCIACYLSWKFDTFWYVFIHLASINLLWVYSMRLKRKFLIGNMVIALLTALVPILCGIHFLGLTTPYKSTNFFSEFSSSNSWVSQVNLKIFFVLAFAFFAGILNLIRELIKDMEDVPGDLLLRAKTVPISLGLTKTKWIVIGLIVATMLIAIPFGLDGYWAFSDKFLHYMWPLTLLMLLLIAALIQLFMSIEKHALKRTDLLLKLAMFIGCSLPYYWYFL